MKKYPVLLFFAASLVGVNFELSASFPYGHRFECMMELGREQEEIIERETGTVGGFTKGTLEDLAKKSYDILGRKSVLAGELQIGKIVQLPIEYTLIVREISPDHRQLLFSDLIGRLFCAKAREEPPHHTFVPLWECDFPKHAPTAPPEKGFVLPSDLSAFAGELTLRHMPNSSSWRESSSGAYRKEMVSARNEVNRSMLLHLTKQKPLTIKTLEEWNRILGRASSTRETAHYYPLHGVLRGTMKDQKLEDGQEIEVDNRFMPQSFSFASKTLGPEKMRCVPPETVPARTQALVDRINRIDGTATLRDCIQIYREFLLIHSFLDAHGREGRVLLDFVLLKAGFPPAPLFSEAPRFLTWASEDDALELLASKFAESGK